MDTKKNIGRDDWLTLGFQMLAQEGADSLKAEVLAKKMGKTKGSFYWHFVDIGAFKTEMLEFWRSKAFTEILKALTPIKEKQQRLKGLIILATRDEGLGLGGRAIEPSIRAWGHSSVEVAAAVEAVDAERIEWLVAQFQEISKDARFAATVFYASYIGLDSMTSVGSEERKIILSQLLSQLTSETAAQ